MFGLGLSEILLILGIGLIFIGPERLPDLARSLARGYSEFRRSFDEMKNNLEKDIRAVDSENLLQKGKTLSQDLQDFRKTTLAQLDTQLTPPPAASSPYPEEAAAEAQSEPLSQPQPIPAPTPTPTESRADARIAARGEGFPEYRTEFRSLLKSELKYELKAELMAELKAELAAARQAESTHES